MTKSFYNFCLFFLSILCCLFAYALIGFFHSGDTWMELKNSTIDIWHFLNSTLLGKSLLCFTLFCIVFTLFYKNKITKL